MYPGIIHAPFLGAGSTGVTRGRLGAFALGRLRHPPRLSLPPGTDAMGYIK